jgi:hypothetical protein
MFADSSCEIIGDTDIKDSPRFVGHYVDEVLFGHPAMLTREH